MTRYHAFRVAVVILLTAVPFVMPLPLVSSLTYVGLYVLVCIGLVILTGVARMVSFGQAAFCGLSAYTTAILTTRHGWAPIATLPVAVLLTAAVATMLGWLTTRLAGHYLVLGTLAWGIGLFYVFGSAPGLGGFNGIVGVPALSLFGRPLTDPHHVYILIWALVGVGYVVAHNLLDSRIGRAIRALPNRIMAESFGIATAALRVKVFVLAALFAAVSGWLHAHYIRVVNPGPFGAGASIDYLFMIILGGISNLGGALVGPLVFEAIRTWLREFLPQLLGSSGAYEIVVFGVLVIVILHGASGGLMSLLSRFLPKALAKQPPTDAAPLPTRARPEVGTTLLSARGISKSFGGLAAVENMSFDLRAGEILALIGPNGAGKSTIFNLLTRVLPLSAGEIWFDGGRMDRLPQHVVARFGIARTFQHVAMQPKMTVLENVAIGAHLRGSAGMAAASFRLERTEEGALLFEAQRQLARVGLAASADLLAGNLALGQQRLLEIARALSADPVVLLLDEPAAGLRYGEKQQLAALLRQLREEGLSILLVEHDMDFVMNLADRIVVADFGQKIAEGTPSEVRADPRVLEAYLGGIDEEDLAEAKVSA